VAQPKKTATRSTMAVKSEWNS